MIHAKNVIVAALTLLGIVSCIAYEFNYSVTDERVKVDVLGLPFPPDEGAVYDDYVYPDPKLPWFYWHFRIQLLTAILCFAGVAYLIREWMEDLGALGGLESPAGLVEVDDDQQ